MSNMEIRSKIDVGTVFTKKNNKYVVCGKWFEFAGNSMVVEAIKVNDDLGSHIRIKVSQLIYDEDIEKLKIVKY